MKMKTVFAVAALVALSATAGAAPDKETPPHARHPVMMQAYGFMGALRRLDLTPEQQQSIHNLVTRTREQNGPKDTIDWLALQNPGDPNYAAAVQNAQRMAADRIEQESALRTQVYALLTTDQQAKLPQVLKDMKSRAEQRREEWRQRRNQPAKGGAEG